MWFEIMLATGREAEAWSFFGMCIESRKNPANESAAIAGILASNPANG